jgi:hypothetical protein
MQETPRCDCQRCKEAKIVLGRPGNDLLSRVLRHSTIGAEEFNGRVRDGIGFLAPRSNHRTGEGQQAREPVAPPQTFQLKVKVFLCRSWRLGTIRFRKADRPPVLVHGNSQGNGRSRRRLRPTFKTMITDSDHESNQANRAISTSKLNTSPRLHTWPINVVVFHGSQGSTRFKVGFPLRCLQRLSRPYIATLHCGWRHNSSTRGTSIPVLSY